MPRNASPGTVQTSWALLTYARISLFHVKRSNSRYGSFLRRSALITSSAGFTEAIPGNGAAGGKFRRYIMINGLVITKQASWWMVTGRRVSKLQQVIGTMFGFLPNDS